MSRKDLKQNNLISNFRHDAGKYLADLGGVYPKLAQEIKSNFTNLIKVKKDQRYDLCAEIDQKIRAQNPEVVDAKIYGVGSFLYFKEQIMKLVNGKESDIKPNARQEEILKQLQKKKPNITQKDLIEADRDWRTLADPTANQFTLPPFIHFCEQIDLSLKGNQSSEIKEELLVLPSESTVPIWPPLPPKSDKPVSLTLALIKNTVPRDLEEASHGGKVGLQTQFNLSLLSQDTELLAQHFYPYDSTEPLTEKRVVLNELVRMLDKKNRKILYKRLTGCRSWKNPGLVEKALLEAVPEIVIDQLEEYLNDASINLETVYKFILKNKDRFLLHYKKIVLTFTGFTRLADLFKLLELRNTLFFTPSEVASAAFENMESRKDLTRSISYCLLDNVTPMGVFRWCNSDFQPKKDRNLLLNQLFIHIAIHQHQNLKAIPNLLTSMEMASKSFRKLKMEDQKDIISAILDIINPSKTIDLELKRFPTRETDSSSLHPSDSRLLSSSLSSALSLIPTALPTNLIEYTGPISLVECEDDLETIPEEDPQYKLIYQLLAKLVLYHFDQFGSAKLEYIFNKLVSKGNQHCYMFAYEVVGAEIQTFNEAILKNRLLTFFALQVAATFELSLIQFMRPNASDFKKEYQGLLLDTLINKSNPLRAQQIMSVELALFEYDRNRNDRLQSFEIENALGNAFQSLDPDLQTYFWQDNWENIYNGFTILRLIFVSLPNSLHTHHRYKHHQWPEVNIALIVNNACLMLKMDKWSLYAAPQAAAQYALYQAAVKVLNEDEANQFVNFITVFLGQEKFNDNILGNTANSLLRIYKSLPRDLAKMPFSTTEAEQIINECLSDPIYSQILPSKRSLQESKMIFIERILLKGDIDQRTKIDFIDLLAKEDYATITAVQLKHLKIYSQDTSYATYQTIRSYINDRSYLDPSEEEIKRERTRRASQLLSSSRTSQIRESKAEPEEPEDVDLPSTFSNFSVRGSIVEIDEKESSPEIKHSKNSRVALEDLQGSTVNHLMSFIKIVYCDPHFSTLLKTKQTKLNPHILQLLQMVGTPSMPLRCFFEILDMTSLWGDLLALFKDVELDRIESPTLKQIVEITNRSTQNYGNFIGFRVALEFWLLCESDSEIKTSLTWYLEKILRNHKDVLISFIASEFIIPHTSDFEPYFDFHLNIFKRKEELAQTFYAYLMKVIAKYVLFSNERNFATFPLMLIEERNILSVFFRQSNSLEEKSIFLKQLVWHYAFHHGMQKKLYQGVKEFDEQYLKSLHYLQEQTIALIVTILKNRFSTDLHESIYELITFKNRIFSEALLKEIATNLKLYPDKVKDALRLVLLQQGLRLEHSLLPKNYFETYLKILTTDYYQRPSQREVEGGPKSLEQFHYKEAQPIATLDFLFPALGLSQGNSKQDLQGYSVAHDQKEYYMRVSRIADIVLEGWGAAHDEKYPHDLKHTKRRLKKINYLKAEIYLKTYFSKPGRTFQGLMQTNIARMLYLDFFEMDALNKNYICLQALKAIIDGEFNSELIASLLNICYDRNNYNGSNCTRIENFFSLLRNAPNVQSSENADFFNAVFIYLGRQFIVRGISIGYVIPDVGEIKNPHRLDLLATCTHLGITPGLKELENETKNYSDAEGREVLNFLFKSIKKEIEFRFENFKKLGSESNPYCVALYTAPLITVFQITEIIKATVNGNGYDLLTQPPLTMDDRNSSPEKLIAKLLGLRHLEESKELKYESESESDSKFFFEIIIIFKLAQAYGPRDIELDMFVRALDLIEKECNSNRKYKRWDFLFFKIVTLVNAIAKTSLTLGSESHDAAKILNQYIDGFSIAIKLGKIKEYLNFCVASPCFDYISNNFDKPLIVNDTENEVLINRHFNCIKADSSRKELLIKHLNQITEIKESAPYEIGLFKQLLLICFECTNLEPEINTFVDKLDNDLKQLGTKLKRNLLDKIRLWSFSLIKKMPNYTQIIESVVCNLLFHLNAGIEPRGISDALVIFDSAQKILQYASSDTDLREYCSRKIHNECPLIISYQLVERHLKVAQFLNLMNISPRTTLVFPQFLPERKIPNDELSYTKLIEKRKPLEKTISAFPIKQSFSQILIEAGEKCFSNEFKTHYSKINNTRQQVIIAQIMLLDYNQYLSRDHRELLFYYIKFAETNVNAFEDEARNYGTKALLTIQYYLNTENVATIVQVLNNAMNVLMVISELRHKKPGDYKIIFFRKILIYANDVIVKESAFNPQKQLTELHHVFSNLAVVASHIEEKVHAFEDKIFAQKAIPFAILKILQLLWKRDNQVEISDQAEFLSKNLTIDLIENLMSFEIDADKTPICNFSRTETLINYLLNHLPNKSVQDQNLIDKIETLIYLKQPWKNDSENQKRRGRNCGKIIADEKIDSQVMFATIQELANQIDYLLSHEIFIVPSCSGSPQFRLLTFLSSIIGPQGEAELKKTLQLVPEPSLDKICELISQSIGLLNTQQRWKIWNMVIGLLTDKSIEIRGSKIDLEDFLEQLKGMENAPYLKTIIAGCLSMIQDNISQSDSIFDHYVTAKIQRVNGIVKRFDRLWRENAKPKDLLPVFNELFNEIQDLNLELPFYVLLEANDIRQTLQDNKPLINYTISKIIIKEIEIAAGREKQKMFQDAFKIIFSVMEESELASSDEWMKKIGDPSKFELLRSPLIRSVYLDAALGITHDSKRDDTSKLHVVKDYKNLLTNPTFLTMPVVEAKQARTSNRWIGKIPRFEDIFTSLEPAAVCFFRYYLTANSFATNSQETDKCLSWIKNGFELDFEMKTSPEPLNVLARSVDLIFRIFRNQNGPERVFSLDELKRTGVIKLEQYAEFLLNKLLLEWNAIVHRHILELKDQELKLKKFAVNVFEAIKIVFSAYDREPLKEKSTLNDIPILSYPQEGSHALDGSLNALYQLYLCYGFEQISKPLGKKIFSFIKTNYWRCGSAKLQAPAAPALPVYSLARLVKRVTHFPSPDSAPSQYLLVPEEKMDNPIKMEDLVLQSLTDEVKDDSLEEVRTFAQQVVEQLPDHSWKALTYNQIMSVQDENKRQALVGRYLEGLGSLPELYISAPKFAYGQYWIHFYKPESNSGSDYILIEDENLTNQLETLNGVSDEKTTRSLIAYCQQKLPHLNNFKVTTVNSIPTSEDLRSAEFTTKKLIYLEREQPFKLISDRYFLLIHVEYRLYYCNRNKHKLEYIITDSELIVALNRSPTLTSELTTRLQKYFLSKQLDIKETTNIILLNSEPTAEQLDSDRPGWRSDVYLEKVSDPHQIYFSNHITHKVDHFSITDQKIINELKLCAPSRKVDDKVTKSILFHAVDLGTSILDTCFLFYKKWLWVQQLSQPDAHQLLPISDEEDEDIYEADSKSDQFSANTLEEDVGDQSLQNVIHLLVDKDHEKMLPFYEDAWKRAILPKQVMIVRLVQSGHYLTGFVMLAFIRRAIAIQKIGGQFELQVNTDALVQISAQMLAHIGSSVFQQFGPTGIFQGKKDFNDLLTDDAATLYILNQFANKTVTLWQDGFLTDGEEKGSSPLKLLNKCLKTLESKTQDHKQEINYLSLHCKKLMETDSKQHPVRTFFDIFSSGNSKVHMAYIQKTLIWAIEQWRSTNDYDVIFSLLTNFCHPNLNIAPEDLLLSRLFGFLPQLQSKKIISDLSESKPAITEWSLVENFCQLAGNNKDLKSINGSGLTSLVPFIKHFIKSKNITALNFFTDPEFNKAYDIFSLISIILRILGASRDAILVACCNLKTIEIELRDYLVITKNMVDDPYSLEMFNLEFLINMLNQPTNIDLSQSFSHGEIPLEPSQVMQSVVDKGELKLNPRQKEWFKALGMKCLGRRYYVALSNKETRRRWQILIEEGALNNKGWLPVFHFYNLHLSFISFFEKIHNLFKNYPINSERWKDPIVEFITILQENLGYSITLNETSVDDYIAKVLGSATATNAEKTRYGLFTNLVAILYDEVNLIFARTIKTLKWPEEVSLNENDLQRATLAFGNDFFRRLFTPQDDRFRLRRGSIGRIAPVIKYSFLAVCDMEMQQYKGILINRTDFNDKTPQIPLVNKIQRTMEQQFNNLGLHCFLFVNAEQTKAFRTQVDDVLKFSKTLIIKHSESKDPSYSLGCVYARPILKAVEYSSITHWPEIQKDEYILIYKEKNEYRLFYYDKETKRPSNVKLFTKMDAEIEELISIIDRIPDGFITLEHNFRIRQLVYGGCSAVDGCTGYKEADYKYLQTKIVDEEVITLIEQGGFQNNSIIYNQTLIKRIMEMAMAPYEGTAIAKAFPQEDKQSIVITFFQGLMGTAKDPPKVRPSSSLSASSPLLLIGSSSSSSSSSNSESKFATNLNSEDLITLGSS